MKLNRAEALILVKENVKNENLIKHMIAVEYVMKALAPMFDGDPEKWALTGLLHDIDYDMTATDIQQHSILGAKMLEDLGMEDDVVYAVKVHNGFHEFPRRTAMDKALHISDPLTGLIVAATLVHPDKKVASLDSQFVLKKFKEKGFAKGANRNTIMKCEEELGMELKDFISIGLEAMKGCADEIGL